MGKRAKEKDTIFFINYVDIPVERHQYITYNCIMTDYLPQKDKPNCTQLTVGDNLIEYPRDVSTRTSDTTMANIL